MAVSVGKAITNAASIAWATLTGKPTTIAGYGITDAPTLTGSATLQNKTLDNTNTVTLKDTLFTLQDDGDTTKQVQFQLSGLTTATTVTLTAPNTSGTLATLSGLAQTFTNTTTFSGQTVSVGTATSASTIGIATGATTTGVTKAVNIGTAGASGSTTTISVGPTAGAGGGTVTFNGGLTLVGSIAPLGYATGAGGTVTQLTSRTTGVTLNKVSGAITLFAAAGSTTPATFTVTNTLVAITDTITLNQRSGTNLYQAIVTAVAAGSFNVTFWTTGGVASDSPVFNFNVLKGVNA